MVGMANFVTCPSCGAFIEGGEGPTHEYIGAPAGCWKMYGVVLEREYADYPTFERTHQLTVDAYAAQHPGVPGPQQQRSVNTHLVGLYLVLEKGMEAGEVKEAFRKLGEMKEELPWLTPPKLNKAKNVVDVARTGNAEEHARQVEAWARSVWEAWTPHHEHVRALAEKVA